MHNPQTLVDEVLNCPSLPMIPGIALQVLQLTEDAGAGADRVAEVMGRDPVLAGRVLKAANSLAPRNVSTLRQAVVLLGMRSVSALALGVSLSGALRQSSPLSDDLQAVWRRSLYTAIAGRLLAGRTRLAPEEEVFLGGLFQDIGMLGMQAVLGQSYADVVGRAGAEGLCQAEKDAFGIDHAAVGAAMARAWALPDRLVAPVAFHHAPESALPEQQPTARLVASARLLSDVLLSEDTVAAARIAGESLAQAYTLDSPQIQDLLQTLALQAEGLAGLFEVQAVTAFQAERILARAQEALIRAAMEADAEAQRLRDANRELAEAAGRDRLTGLHNRARLEEVKQEVLQQARKDGYSLAALFIDADHFKTVNDIYGHAAGDQVLRRLGQIVSRWCGQHAYRFGGEEIVCLLPRCDRRSAAAAAERMRRDVESVAVDHDGRSILFTVSIGVAVARGHEIDDLDQLLAAADESLYAAKHSGRNRVLVNDGTRASFG